MFMASVTGEIKEHNLFDLAVDMTCILSKLLMHLSVAVLNVVCFAML